MEQFKRLKWSWHKYEEDKEYLPRNFNFETLNDNDSLSRNLNEIHTCVIPQQNEYRIFKTPKELAANHFEFDTSGHIIELKDPRKLPYQTLESSSDLIKTHSYSSELKKHEQILILNVLRINNTIHNPKLLTNSNVLEKSHEEVPKEVQEKWQKEVEHFQRCAEIFYHRHITQFNSLLCTDLKDLLIDKWKKLELLFPHTNYQAITMLLRNSAAKASKPSLNFVQNLCEDFKSEFYTAQEDLFPNLKNVQASSLKIFLKTNELEANNITKADIHISLDVLTKLFVNGTEFNTIFKNENNCSKFIFNETVPLKKVMQSDALEEAVRLIINFNIEWHNASKCIKVSSRQNIDYKPHSISETMSKIFKNYKKHAGVNNEISLWRLEIDSQNLSISVCNNNCYLANDGSTKIIYSIKLEYQTNFGAEQMSRAELLKEWIQIKFSQDTIIIRLRIDVKSMEILSATKLSITDIERELKELYNYDPIEALSILFNVFNCIHNLPESSYIIQAQNNENDCNKLLIYKEVPEGRKIINDEDFSISETFTRKWVQIDRKTCSFLHLNDLIAPCCFSHKPSKCVSYIMPKIVKAVSVAKKVEQKSPKKVAVLRRRTRSKKKKIVKKLTATKYLK